MRLIGFSFITLGAIIRFLFEEREGREKKKHYFQKPEQSLLISLPTNRPPPLYLLHEPLKFSLFNPHPGLFVFFFPPKPPFPPPSLFQFQLPRPPPPLFLRPFSPPLSPPHSLSLKINPTKKNPPAGGGGAGGPLHQSDISKTRELRNHVRGFSKAKVGFPKAKGGGGRGL